MRKLLSYADLLMVPGEFDLKLRSAADLGDLGEVRQLLKKAANVNSCSEHGVTALHLAVAASHPEVVTALIEGEAHLDTTNRNGQTALHIAAGRGELDLVRLLTAAGCDVNVTTQYSQMTALHLAARQGHTAICRHLLDHGADSHITDQIDKPAYFYAVNEDIRQMLLTESLRKEPLADQYARKISLDTAHNISLNDSLSIDDSAPVTSRDPVGSVFTPPPAAVKQKKMPPAKRVSVINTGRGRRFSQSPRVVTRKNSVKGRLTKKGSFKKS